MRVLDTVTGQFVVIDPNDPWRPPKHYAILSHTWRRKGEQTYQQLRDIQKQYTPSNDSYSSDDSNSSNDHCDDGSLPYTVSNHPLSPIWSDPKLSSKIREACRVAREHGYRYLWIDSCCIDKTSSSELSESINSMYQWYAAADVCYAFLQDVPAEEDHKRTNSRFRRSCWFGRGWTLQELIAPGDVVFLSKDWAVIDSKFGLGSLVAEITNIDYNALLHVEPLAEFSVAQRLSWAAKRQTTRAEDRAYSLLGIFGINMPTLYGEGDGAFRRLQEEIMRRTPDQSLFAWTRFGLPDPSSDHHDPESAYKDEDNRQFVLIQYPSPSSLLAPSLDLFSKCAGIEALSHDEVVRRLRLPTGSGLPTTDYDFTPYGIRLQLPVIPLSSSNYFPPECVDEHMIDVPLSQWYLVILGCGDRDFPKHLLGRTCYTQSPGSSIESLYSGGIIGMGEVLPVSPTTIARTQSHISVKTLYIPQPQRSDKGAMSLAHLKQHDTIKLVLLKKTREALSAQGYAPTLRAAPGPDDAHPTGTHLVTLSHDTHTITIHYRHTIAEHRSGQQWSIEADVKMWGPILQGGALPQINGHGESQVSQVCWTAHLPWVEKLDVQDVKLILPGCTELTVRLGLAFAARNHYVLCIELRPTPANPDMLLLLDLLSTPEPEHA